MRLPVSERAEVKRDQEDEMERCCPFCQFLSDLLSTTRWAVMRDGSVSKPAIKRSESGAVCSNMGMKSMKSGRSLRDHVSESHRAPSDLLCCVTSVSHRAPGDLGVKEVGAGFIGRIIRWSPTLHFRSPTVFCSVSSMLRHVLPVLPLNARLSRSCGKLWWRSRGNYGLST